MGKAVLNHSHTSARFVASKAFDLWFENVFIQSCYLTQFDSYPLSLHAPTVDIHWHVTAYRLSKGILKFPKYQEGSQTAVSWHLAVLATKILM